MEESITAVIVTVINTILFRKIALKLGIVDNPGELKIHKEPVPYLGGIAIFISFGLVTLIFDFYVAKIYWMLSLLLLLIGLWDDIFFLSAKIRFILESFIFVIFLIFVNFRLPGTYIFSVIVLYIFFMGTVNSVNWMDGMDGIMAGVSLVSSIGFFVFSKLLGNNWAQHYWLIFSGVLLGFLLLNFHPAKIFLGDAGSYFVGFSLFYGSIKLLKFDFSWKNFLVILSILGAFIVDSTSAVTRRILQKRNPFSGDRYHIYDLIFYKLKNYALTSIVMYGIALVAVILGILVYYLPSQIYIYFWVLGVITSYFILYKLEFICVINCERYNK